MADMSISSAPSRNSTSSAPAAAICARVQAALARHEAEVEPADAGGRRVQHGKAVPAVLAPRRRSAQASPPAPSTAAPSGARQSALPDDDQRVLGLLQRLRRSAVAVGQIAQRLGAGAEMLVVVGQVGRVADHADRQIAGAPALADAGVEHRRFEARIGADDQDRVGLLDAGDGRVEEVAGAAERRVERRAVLAAVDVRRAERAPSAPSAQTSPRRAARSPAMAPMRSARRPSTLRRRSRAKASAQVAGTQLAVARGHRAGRGAACAGRPR